MEHTLSNFIHRATRLHLVANLVKPVQNKSCQVDDFRFSHHYNEARSQIKRTPCGQQLPNMAESGFDTAAPSRLSVTKKNIYFYVLYLGHILVRSVLLIMGECVLPLSLKKYGSGKKGPMLVPDSRKFSPVRRILPLDTGPYYTELVTNLLAMRLKSPGRKVDPNLCFGKLAVFCKYWNWRWCGRQKQVHQMITVALRFDPFATQMGGTEP